MLGGDFKTPIVFCDITHQCFAGKKLKNLNFSASGTDTARISYYVRGLQYWPSGAKLALRQNPAGAVILIQFAVITY
jgi:hypothetical protein